MSTDKPTPLTPEGRRAADRVRSIFFLIAAANIVIAIIVLLFRSPTGKDRDNAPTKRNDELPNISAPGK
jgi:cell division protein FtsN